MAQEKLKNGVLEFAIRYYSPNGKHIELECLSSKDEKAARDLLASKLQEILNFLTGADHQDDLLFLDVMQTWLDDIMVNQVRYNTLIQYKRAFEYNVKTYSPFQGLPLNGLTPTLLQKFYNEKAKSGMSPNTIHKLHANIHKCLKYAVSLNMIPMNPSDRVTLPRKEKPDVGRAYTPQQLQELVTAFQGDALELVVYLTVMYGLRRSEVCGLRWVDVNFSDNCIHVCHTAVSINGEVIRSNQTKSKSSRRTLPMSVEVKDRLEKAKAGQQQLPLTSGYVCIRPDGSPFNPDFVSHHFARVLHGSGLPKIRFHDIRHSVASLLHDNGFDLRDIMEWMGHSDVSTTGNIYSHVTDERVMKMAETIQMELKVER